MKRYILLLLILVLLFSGTAFATIEEVNVKIPDFRVSVNGVLIDTEHSQYPVISYKGITYFPMTSDYLEGIGLDLLFDDDSGLKINVNSKANRLEQRFLGVKNILGSIQKARLVPFDVEVNGITINNDEEEYPVLLYKDITYFPMTWRFAVTEFGWKTRWSNESGFEISIANKENKMVEDKSNELVEVIDTSIEKNKLRIIKLNGRYYEYKDKRTGFVRISPDYRLYTVWDNFNNWHDILSGNFVMNEDNINQNISGTIQVTSRSGRVLHEETVKAEYDGLKTIDKIEYRLFNDADDKSVVIEKVNNELKSSVPNLVRKYTMIPGYPQICDMSVLETCFDYKYTYMIYMDEKYDVLVLELIEKE